MRAEYREKVFDDQYNYNGNDLGVTYSTQVSLFKVWSPVAKEIEVLLYAEGDCGEPIKKLPMTCSKEGVWQAEELGDLKGMYYTYLVDQGDETYEVVDPYAKAVGVNGNRAMILDLRETDPIGWQEQARPRLENPTDAIIYELHVRDLSMDSHSGITHQGKYLGLTEHGTHTVKGDKTGLDHLIELGVTHVQLLPCYDYISVDETKPASFGYNWGYDPLNYNAPEGSYATDPYHGEVRIKEFKEAIMTLHNEGIGVIMDVVYNHTAQGEDSKLNLLVPHYYHRVLESGEYSNGSACGNEIASERYMVRKMIIDSLVHWVTEYKIDGFRFDLMGIMDIETMNEISRTLRKINPDIILYGEGWTGGPCALPEERRAMKKNTMQLDGVGVFSDDIRDAIKGSVFEAKAPGFVSGGTGMEESIKFGIVAATKHDEVDYEKVNYSDEPYAKEPGQCINYVSVHDDLTLWDKLKVSASTATTEERLRMQRLSVAIVLLAQGVPLLHAGVELVRSKLGVHNSYKSSDRINCIRWKRKHTYREVFDYVQGLIRVRKKYSAFRMRTTEEIDKHLHFLEMPMKNMVGFELTDKFIVLFNGNKESVKVDLKEAGWHVIVDGNIAGTDTLMTINNAQIEVEGISTYVLVKE